MWSAQACLRFDCEWRSLRKARVTSPGQRGSKLPRRRAVASYRSPHAWYDFGRRSFLLGREDWQRQGAMWSAQACLRSDCEWRSLREARVTSPGQQDSKLPRRKAVASYRSPHGRFGLGQRSFPLASGNWYGQVAMWSAQARLRFDYEWSSLREARVTSPGQRGSKLPRRRAVASYRSPHAWYDFGRRSFLLGREDWQRQGAMWSAQACLRSDFDCVCVSGCAMLWTVVGFGSIAKAALVTSYDPTEA